MSDLTNRDTKTLQLALLLALTCHCTVPCKRLRGFSTCRSAPVVKGGAAAEYMQPKISLKCKLNTNINNLGCFIEIAKNCGKFYLHTDFD